MLFCFPEKTEECDTIKFEWRELYHLALKHHGSVSLVFQHVLSQHQNSGERFESHFMKLDVKVVCLVFRKLNGQIKSVITNVANNVILILTKEYSVLCNISPYFNPL